MNEEQINEAYKKAYSPHFDESWFPYKDGYQAALAQIERELSEARKDQERYLKFMELFISDDFPVQVATAETKAEWDAIIDAAIKEQGK